MRDPSRPLICQHHYNTHELYSDLKLSFSSTPFKRSLSSSVSPKSSMASSSSSSSAFLKGSAEGGGRAYCMSVSCTSSTPLSASSTTWISCSSSHTRSSKSGLQFVGTPSREVSKMTNKTKVSKPANQITRKIKQKDEEHRKDKHHEHHFFLDRWNPSLSAVHSRNHHKSPNYVILHVGYTIPD